MPLKYNRVIIKLSGEAFKAETPSKTNANLIETLPLDFDKVDEVASALVQLSSEGLQMGIVIGGGNIYRGRQGKMYNQADGDNMGMLSTLINSLALADAIRKAGGDCCVMSAIQVEQVCDTYSQRDAKKKIAAGEILIFACGFGRPYFSTDTAAVIRALELDADVLVCGKNVDGLYNRDPNEKKDEPAVFLSKVSYRRALIDKEMNALDDTAIVLSEKHKLSMIFFKLKNPQHLIDAMHGDIERFSYVGADVEPKDISEASFADCYA